MLFQENFYLIVGFIMRDGIALLNQPGQLLLMSFRFQQLIIGQLSPSYLGGANQLLPFSFDPLNPGCSLVLMWCQTISTSS